MSLPTFEQWKRQSVKLSMACALRPSCRLRWPLALAVVLLMAGGSLVPAPVAHAQSLPAFPGAQGYGAFARGGRGGRVLFVTNRNDDGPGSLRSALQAAGPRVVIFRVGGVITLHRTLEVTNPYLTIAGQTAPGEGVVLSGAGIRIRASEVIIRNLRIRVGDSPDGGEPGSRDGIAIAGYPGQPVRNIIIDQCSVSWAIDENASVYQAEQVTLQWSLLTEGLEHSLHPEGRHSNGLLLAEGARQVTVHHTLLAHNGYRNPLIKGNTAVAFVGNVIHNWGRGALIIEDPARAGPSTVVIGQNVFTPGPATTNAVVARVHRTTHPDAQIYFGPNTGMGRQVIDRPVLVHRPPLTDANAPALGESPEQLRSAVLARAGAVAPKRDAVDARVIATVRAGTGRLIDGVAEVGGWEVLRRWDVGDAPADGDQDGMTDAWERTHGLDPGDSADGGQTGPGGYPWLEVYLDALMSSSGAGAPAPTVPPTMSPTEMSPTASPTPSPTPPSPTDAPTIQPTPPGLTQVPPVAAQDQVIDDEGLAPGWVNWSWATKLVADGGAATPSGGRSLAVTYQAPWAGLRLHTDQPLPTAGRHMLRIWLHGGATGGQALQLYLETGSARSPQIPLPEPIANRWTLAEVPLAQLGQPAQITDLVIQDAGGPIGRTYFVGSIGLAFVAPALPPPTSIPADGAQAIYDNGVAPEWASRSWGRERPTR